jgi:hypothetical protein
VADGEDETVTLKLEKARRRFDPGEPTTRYRFVVLHSQPAPEELPEEPHRPAGGVDCPA